MKDTGLLPPRSSAQGERGAQRLAAHQERDLHLALCWVKTRLLAREAERTLALVRVACVRSAGLAGGGKSQAKL